MWSRYVTWASRHGAWVVLAALVIASAGAWSAQRLRVDASLRALLPADSPSIQQLDALRERADEATPLVLLFASPDPSLNRALALQAKEQLAAWPETRWAVARRDLEVLSQRRILYLPANDLEALADDIEERAEWDQCRAIPGCVTLLDRPPLPDLEEVAERLAQQPAFHAVERLLGEKRTDDPFDAGGGDAEPTGWLCAPSGHVCAVHASLTTDADDVEEAARVLARAQALLEGLRAPDAPPSLRMEVSGRFRNAPMTRALAAEDLLRVGLMSSALLVLWLIAQFRGPGALVVLVVPVAVAIAVTLGLVALVHPALNLISAFTLAILAGLGVDFGLHLLTHFGALREEGQPPATAVRNTMAQLGKALLVAGVTTACAFAALMAARFRGFSEMGAMACLGIALSLVAFVVLFAPLTLLLSRLRPSAGSPLRTFGLRTLPVLRMRWAALILGAGGAAALAGLLALPRVQLEHDFRRLEPGAIAHGITTSDAIHGTSGLAVMLMGDSPESLARLTRSLEEEGVDAPGGEDAFLLTPEALVPADQDRRLAAVARIRTALDDVAPRLEGEAARDFARMRPWLDVQAPITPADLPEWLQTWFVDRDGGFGRIGVLFLPIRGSDARAMEELANAIERWRRKHPAIIVASPDAVLGEVMPGLRSDGPLILLWALLGLTVAVLAVGRSPRRAALVLAPVTLAMLASTALIVLLGLRLNLYNLLVIPVAFGVGVDGAIYITWALDGTAPLKERWAHLMPSARATLGSGVTTLAAFGSLSLARHPGLASIGHLALITIGMTLLANLFWLPALFAAGAKRKPRRPPLASGS
jgi:uncharacterized protein